jgi:hypothetical protein
MIAEFISVAQNAFISRVLKLFPAIWGSFFSKTTVITGFYPKDLSELLVWRTAQKKARRNLPS